MIRLILMMLVMTSGVNAQEAVRDFGLNTAMRHITLRSTTDLAIFAPVVDTFIAANPDVHITYEQWGSNDLYALTQAECMGEPRADLVISSAVQQMVALVNAGCAEAHQMTSPIPDDLNWRDELWGVTREPAVMVYNRILVPREQVPLSRFDLLDLLRPENSPYHGRVATYDIETSGLGYLLAYADSLQATTFGALMESFGRSSAVATCCSAEIIDAVAKGDYLIAYNVLGSYALERAGRDRRLGIIAPSDYTLILSRAAMIPKGAQNAAAAAGFVDFLLGNAGRSALEDALLFAPLSATEGALIEAPEAIESVERVIPLNPTLLIALDDHKRMLFTTLWRDAFPK